VEDIHEGFLWLDSSQFARASTLHIVKASRSHSDTLPSVGLLWTSNQPVADTCNWPQGSQKRHLCRLDFEPALPASERPQTHALTERPWGSAGIEDIICVTTGRRCWFFTPKRLINHSFLVRSVRTFKFNTTSSVFWPSLCVPYGCYHEQWLFPRTALSDHSNNNLTMFPVRYELHLHM
jgi:hypothetical protein